MIYQEHVTYSQVTTTATRRVLVRTRVCNTLCAQWGVIDGNAAVLLVRSWSHRNIARTTAGTTRRLGILTQEALFLAVRHCIGLVEATRTQPPGGNRSCCRDVWLLQLFEKQGVTRVSLSLSAQHTQTSMLLSCATRPARRTSPLPPRSRTPGPRSLTMTLETTTPATYSPRGRRLPHAVADGRRPRLTWAVPQHQQPRPSAMRHDPGAVRT
jgi:hypothetical protein